MSRPGLPDNLIKKIQDLEDRIKGLEATNAGGEIPSGLLAARPLIQNVRAGFEYFATDVEGGTLFKSQGGVWVVISKVTPNFTPENAYYPTTPWWGEGGGDGSVPLTGFAELTSASGALSRITMPTSSVATYWEPYYQVMARATASNWVQLLATVNLVNAGGTLLANWAAYNSSYNRKNANTDDWVTMVATGTPFLMPANTSGWQLIPYIGNAGSNLAAIYNRSYVYNNFKVKRVG